MSSTVPYPRAAPPPVNFAEQDRTEIATVQELAARNTATGHEHMGNDDLVQAYARALDELQILLGRLVFLVDYLSRASKLQGMAPYPWPGNQPGPWSLAGVLPEARCQGGPEAIFRRKTRSALDIEGQHGTIQGPSPALTPVQGSLVIAATARGAVQVGII